MTNAITIADYWSAHARLAWGYMEADPETLADGLLTGLGRNTFLILREHGVEIVTVTEAAIEEACRFHLFRMKQLVEPSGATCLAALRSLGKRIEGLRIGAIITGGNTDLSWLESQGSRT